MESENKFLFGDKPTVAIDFDGTIVKKDYPFIGKPKAHAIPAIREIKSAGWYILIWTCRTGKHLEDVKKFLDRWGIEVDGVNENLPIYEKFDFNDSRKLGADIYIGDDSLFFIDDWQLIRERLLEIYDGRDE